jgi:transcriptional regulator with XRE-family HTH domain
MVRLAEARAARGLSREALAARAGVGEATIRRAERGQGTPSARVARRLGAALGLPPEHVAELWPAAAQPRLREPMELAG